MITGVDSVFDERSAVVSRTLPAALRSASVEKAWV